MNASHAVLAIFTAQSWYTVSVCGNDLTFSVTLVVLHKDIKIVNNHFKTNTHELGTTLMRYS